MPRPTPPPGPAHTPKQQFGQELRYRRERAGLTAEQLARAVNRDRRTITSAEQGRDLPSEAIVYALEQLLHGEGLLLSYYEAVVMAKRREKLHMDEVHNGVSPDALNEDASEFLRETVPDGTIMLPGQRFDKTWTIRNVGTVPWNERRLSRMGIAAGPGLITTPAFMEIPTTQPGEEITLVIPCIAHIIQGTSIASFKMTDAQKKLYFPYSRYTIGLAVQVTVVERLQRDGQ
ncbi:helix-turn-helix domain-containing protein [Agreia sp. COWG]|uniref:helix-turn-helix domain-containing protein n=1 Tax=Agreia sp. COWG TaxID=2773266 RepID=UPI0019255BE5|nr:helix-turn-helix domain-containing protein [Agreia sp. COWG]CAD6005302.1 HTH cro/C1-type domain-containing protein [Agreia sp. COWG]